MIELAITLGLVISLISYDIFGLAAGGIVVPGYIALQLPYPDRIAGILIVSFLTYLIIKLLGNYIFYMAAGKWSCVFWSDVCWQIFHVCF